MQLMWRGGATMQSMSLEKLCTQSDTGYLDRILSFETAVITAYSRIREYAYLTYEQLYLAYEPL